MFQQPKPQHEPADEGESVIGMLRIDPGAVSERGEYIVDFPRGARALCVGWIDGQIVMWAAVPLPLPGEKPVMRKQRFFVLPGARRVTLPTWAQYLGTVISRDENGEVDHDWHIFFDASAGVINKPADAEYSATVH